MVDTVWRLELSIRENWANEFAGFVLVGSRRTLEITFGHSD